MDESKLQIIVVAGVTGSGKSTFSHCFKNSFLQSLPVMSLPEGVASRSSFYFESSLIGQSQFDYLRKAKASGYKITGYYLFTGKSLSLARARLRQIVKGEPFDETLFKKSYEQSFKGLTELFGIADLLFFIRNQEKFEFLSAYQKSQMGKDDFLKAVKQVRSSVDHLR